MFSLFVNKMKYYFTHTHRFSIKILILIGNFNLPMCVVDPPDRYDTFLYMLKFNIIRGRDKVVFSSFANWYAQVKNNLILIILSTVTQSFSSWSSSMSSANDSKRVFVDFSVFCFLSRSSLDVKDLFFVIVVVVGLVLIASL